MFRAVTAAIASRALRMAGAVRRRAGAFEPAGALIGSADSVERGFGAVLGCIRRSLAHRGIRLTGGLLWRGVAALSGIGLAATLVNAMSGALQPSLASLTVVETSEVAPVRDVRREPRLPVSADSGWAKIARPVAMFGLNSPELERQAVLYEAYQAQNGARRRDELSFGAFAEGRPHLQLRLQVEHGAEHRPHSFVVTLARDVSERGMSVERSGVVTAIATRFGPVDTADALLGDGAASRPCIAFHRSPGEQPLGLSGWWCGSAERPADRQQLICLIDRIDLLGAGEDRALRTAFARSELERKPGCAPSRLAASGRKTNWLDADGQAPPLKTAVRR